jgi:CheY-like chemotaxis protein
MTNVRKRSLSVLVVDDNASMRAALRGIVKGDGHDVIGEAAEGKTALTLIRQMKPDVVLLDMMMPVMDGLAVLTEIKESGLDISVLVVSGNQDPALMQQAFSLGAIGYVTKPLNPDRILQTFEQSRRAGVASSSTVTLKYAACSRPCSLEKMSRSWPKPAMACRACAP